MKNLGKCVGGWKCRLPHPLGCKWMRIHSDECKSTKHPSVNRSCGDTEMSKSRISLVLEDTKRGIAPRVRRRAKRLGVKIGRREAQKAITQELSEVVEMEISSEKAREIMFHGIWTGARDNLCWWDEKAPQKYIINGRMVTLRWSSSDYTWWLS